MMYGQMTAGSWIYIGTQGIVQGTYETFARGRPAALRRGRSRAGWCSRRARRHGRRPAARRDDDDGRLPRRRGRSPRGLPTRLETRATSTRSRPTSSTRSPASASGQDRGEARSIGLVGNAADVYEPACGAAALGPTSSPTRPPRTIRSRLHPARTGSRSRPRPGCARATPTSTSVAPRARWPPRRRDARDADGRAPRVRLRQQPPRARASRAASPDAFDYPGFVPAYIRPLFCEGKGPFRWVALSGDPEDIPRRTRRCSSCSPTTRRCTAGSRWRSERIAFQGLPARICWLGYGERAPGRARASTSSCARGEGEGADRDRPRPPRLRLGRVARTARPRG